MAWFTKFNNLNNLNNLNLGDFAGAVTKLSESVKSIEKNFDSALGFEVKTEASEPALSSEEEIVDPVRLEVEEAAAPAQENVDVLHETSSQDPQVQQTEIALAQTGGQAVPAGDPTDEKLGKSLPEISTSAEDHELGVEQERPGSCSETAEVTTDDSVQFPVSSSPAEVVTSSLSEASPQARENGDAAHKDLETEGVSEAVKDTVLPPEETSNGDSNGALTNGNAYEHSAHDPQSPEANGEDLSKQVQMLEAALQGAARQAQMKADEISRLLIENEDLKATVGELKSKSSDAEIEALRQEYQHRLGTAERKVYALTKERDMLRREQSRKSDLSPLLKEKDEIIKQVMAEGEELSKKQAAQEALMKKLRAQIRELEEEKTRLNSRLQVEEAKVESIRKDKAATEKALQEVVEKGQAELAYQKDYYVGLLNEAKEAEGRAEARASSDAKADLDRRLREAAEREETLLQTLDELRHALSKAEHQAAYREEAHLRDIEELEKRCKGAEERYEELLANMPESTRPLLRQIEALQEATAMKAEAWTGVERSLNARLQEAEANAAASQERERSINERLSQTLSRMAVMEAQLSCLRAEQAQLSRTLEKERQRAIENRQEYLAAAESSANQESRSKQLEEELEEVKKRYKLGLAEERAAREALEQKLEQARAAVADFEKRMPLDSWAAEKMNVPQMNSQAEYSSARGIRRAPSESSAGSVDESYYLQATLDSAERLHGERFSFSEPTHYGKGFVPPATLEQFEAHLRQKEGELASYSSRMISLEATRNSLAEELVKVTTQCEQFRAEATALPALRAEFDSLRRRHTSALELMGERDEEVEELRADLADVKQMYREQIDLLVGQIERLSAGVPSR